MNKIVKLLFIILLTSSASYLQSQTSSVPILRFGLIADTQYANADTKGKRFYRESIPKLEEAIADLNEQNVDFTINLGDLADRSPKDLDVVMLNLKKLKNKVYITTGNHDYNGFIDNNMLFKKLGMPAEYYTFAKKKWRFIMLNTNEVASYANIEASNKEKELAAMKDSIAARGRDNASPYNGGIGKLQMAWFKDQLDKAAKKNENVIVCTHHPLYPEFALTALNDKEILDVIAEYKNVKLILSGHHHAGKFAMFNDIPAVTVEGMIETETNAYGTVEIYEDKIVMIGKGRMTSREFQLK